MKFFKNIIKNIFYIRIFDALPLEKEIRIQFVKDILIIGMIIISIYSILNFLDSDLSLGFKDDCFRMMFIDFLVLIILVILFFLIRRLNFTIISYITCFIIFLYFIYMLITGGVDNTGVIWSVSFPLIAIFLFGLFPGVLISLLFFFIMILSFFVVDFGIAYYTLKFKIRIIGIYLLTTSFSLTYESILNNIIKKLSRAKDNIELVHEQKTNFFINFTHEIKTPLTLILNYMNKYIKSLNNVPIELNIVNNNLNKLKKDIINFLDFEKLDKKLPFYNNDQAINLSNILKNRIQLFYDIAKNRNLKIDSTIENDLCIKMDPLAIDKIINNLLDNAIRYNKNNGSINIILRKRSEDVEFIISDTGLGISGEEKENIFKPFHQISNKKRSIQGIGIGLNIVSKIVEDVRGKIIVESELGKGSTFRLFFKKSEIKENEMLNTSDSDNEYITNNIEQIENQINIDVKESKYNPDKNNIFIIEDNKEMLKFLVDNLNEKYNVFFESNGEKALERITEMPRPDIIISDVMMDEIDGFEFYEELMKYEIFNDIPLIYLTAKSSKEEKLKGLSKGAVDYICKPFSIEELLCKINSIINIKKEQKEFNIKEIKNGILKVISSERQDENFNIQNKIKIDECGFTLKEKKIILLLLNGKEYKEISLELNIAMSTIKKRIHDLYKKYGVHNKIELINKVKGYIYKN